MKQEASLIRSQTLTLKSCKISLALYKVISDVVAAGMIMIGVRETRFPGFFEDESSRGVTTGGLATDLDGLATWGPFLEAAPS